MDKIEERYFFESDMLFRLNIIRAVVEDVPMDCKYAEEVSNLHISKIIHEFQFKHLRNFFKRIFYNYYLRDMSIASFELPIGFGFLLFGLIYGLYNWIKNYNANVLTPTGTIALPALLVIVGIQLLLSFINYDVSNIPHKPLGDKY